MHRLTAIFTLLAIVVIVIDACSTSHSNCHGGGCTHRRRKRATPNTLQSALTEFDIRLTEELSSEIQQMSSEEKQAFINDVGKMNEAVKFEIASVDKNVANIDELLQQLADKVTRDFGGRKWFQRLRSLAGEKISKLIIETAHGSN